MTTTLIHCAAATTNTTNSTKMMTGSKGLLASKDSRTRIKVVKVASYYGGRKGAFRCNAKNPSDGGKGGKNGAGEKKLRGAKALQNKAVSEPPSSQGRQSDLTPAFISPSQFTEMQLSTSQMKNLASQRPTDQTFVSQFAADEPRKGADILVEALEREGVDCVFAYPGGASMEIHQALTRSTTGIRNVLCRHEQGEVFAAEGYGKATGKIGVCIATSGPGATNLVTGLADALLDSVPMVAITGQVPRAMIGTARKHLLACVVIYEGDGYCDSYNNFEGCNWDGGDCCEASCVDATYQCGFSGYNCLDPAYGGSGESDACNTCNLYNMYSGSCGGFSVRSDKWCDSLDVCCSDSGPDACCTANGGAIAGLVIGLLVGIGCMCAGSCYYCRGCPWYNKLRARDASPMPGQHATAMVTGPMFRTAMPPPQSMPNQNIPGQGVYPVPGAAPPPPPSVSTSNGATPTVFGRVVD